MDTVPLFGFAVNPAAIAAGLRPLRDASLRAGDREVRIWTGFGLGMPSAFYRLTTLGDNVRGSLIFFWSHDAEWRADTVESMHSYVRHAFMCGRIRRHEFIEVCEATLDRPPLNWERVLARLDSLGVRTLRAAPKLSGGADIDYVVIETLDGSTYHTASVPILPAGVRGHSPLAVTILDVVGPIHESVVGDMTLKRR